MEKHTPIKKVVHYDKLRDCNVGCRASVWPIDHPSVLVGTCAKTSLVQSFDPLTGVAETANTRYVPSLVATWPGMGEDAPLELTYDDANDTVRLTVMQPFGDSNLLEQDTTQRATDFFADQTDKVLSRSADGG
ncbi:hypothetical protein [Rhodoferax sp.]|uniref:hypothetical protein n=1 Tax=Rhodoferax sp. TaxID=50421 RepID=UPI00284453E8|nr:hypothetical protein [Rhodoferax sp.]MDR3367664.1 hypothetical protein [Rhodoferax sp.]